MRRLLEILLGKSEMTDTLDSKIYPLDDNAIIPVYYHKETGEKHIRDSRMNWIPESEYNPIDY